ncbi:methyl-coenzyme M reductase [Acinetobacter haemolyticus]|uniref:methyl-coenzyme M reductase n=1 Tax=Acinetobacter haemolyticus TaxID=29430 RepID=UPI0014901061|nr:methyl-coenzyme M reductase [Acinetobacter haemolyticus]
MRIPVSRGRVDAQAQMQTFTPNTGLSDIGRTIGGAVQARDEQQREQEVQAKRLELYHNDLDEKEGRIKVDDFLTTSFAEKTTLLRNDVANGVKNSQQASEELKSWTDGEFKSLSESLPMHAQHTYKQYVDSTVGKQGAGFLPLQLKADEQKNISLLDRAFSIATRLPREKRHEYLGSYLAGANISEVQKTEYLRNLDIASDKMDIDSRMLSAVENSDIAGLQTLSGELEQGKYPNLDGETVQNYQKSISSKMASLQQKQQVLEQKRVNEAGKFVDAFKQSVLTGRALDPKYIEDVRTAVSGTEHQADFDFYYNQSQNFQDFGKLDTSEQLKRINQQKAKMKNTTSADPTTENKILSVYESIYQNKVKTIKENPNQALREKGINIPELNPLQLKADPKGFASNIIDIGSYQVSQRDKDANATIKPISPEELPEAKKAFDSLDVNGKLNFIGNLISESKGVKDGSKIWGAALGQLGGGDMNYVMAGVAKANNYHTTEGRDLATSIITGTQLLKNKQLIMPKEDELRLAFNEYVGQTLTGTNANNAYQVFKAVYADTMNARGFSHTAKDASPDKAILKTALGMSTGGVYTQPSKFTNYMGDKGKDWKVTKPYGMDDIPFENRLDQGYSTIAKQTGLSDSELRSLRLRQGKPSATGEIQYDLINERGQPLVVDGAIWRIKMNGVKK